MSEAPPYDGRSEDELVSVTETLVTAFTGWQPSDPDDLDLGGAMVRLLSRLARRAVESVDQAPGRLASEFFEMLGVRPQPPGVARAPLVFTPVEGATRDPIVPRGSEIAAPADDDHADPTSFYTESDLTVVRVPISAVRVSKPEADTADDVTLHALPALAEEAEITPEPWPAFDAETPIERTLYFACDALLANDPPEQIEIALADEGDGSDWYSHRGWLSFESWNGAEWVAAPSAGQARNGGFARFTIAPATYGLAVVEEVEAVWIRARVNRAFAVDDALPAVTDVQMTAVRLLSDRAPAQVMRGLFDVDTTADFAPFGKVPAFNEAIVLDGGDALDQPAGATVQIAVQPSAWHDAAAPSANLIIAVELFTASGWTAVGYSYANGAQVPGGITRLGDTSNQLRQAGTLEFTLPAELPVLEHAGREGRWLRLRMVKGDYGQEPQLTVVDGTAVMTASTLKAPWLESIMLTSRSTQSLAAASGAVRWARRVAGFTRLDPPLGTQPFPEAEVPEPALWIGFGELLGDVPVAFHIEVIPPVADPVTGLLPRNPDWDPDDPPRLEWEASTADGWAELVVDDDTQGLSKSGIVRFIAPFDGVKLDRFGATAQWVRARWVSGSYHHPPKVAAVRLNAVWARAATAIEGEIIGSGTGGVDQTAQVSRTPILAGERLEVQEENGGPWIRWTSVPDFNGSGSEDRHYRLDPATGDVQFGDGRRGRPPPKVTNNIRISYVYGGGASGNRTAGSISSPRSALPLVEEVQNPVASEGGRDAYTPDVVAGDVPRSLRHRERAVALSDYGDIAREASDKVCRVAIIQPEFTRDNPVTFDTETRTSGRGGWVQGIQAAEVASGAAFIGDIEVIIVPHGTEARPNPTQALLDTVHQAIARRSGPAVQLRVTGPRWATVTVDAQLGATAAEAARVVRDATAALDAYLHPLTGGPTGSGWPFGRRPRDSDIQAVLAEVDGVQFVRHLAVDCRPLLPMPEFVGIDRDIALDELDHRQAASVLVATGDHRLTVVEAR